MTDAESSRSAPDPALAQALRQLQDLESAFLRNEEALTRTQVHLFSIYNSNGWKVLDRLYRLRNRLFPPNTWRQQFLVRSLNGCIHLAKRLFRTRMQKAHLADNADYQNWILQNEPRPAALAAQRRTRFQRSPTFSLLVAASQTSAPHLQALLQSVVAQTYEAWELCVVDHNDTASPARALLGDWARTEPRLRVRHLEAGATVDCWNEALAYASGDYAAVIHQADTLAPFALHAVAQALQENPRADLLYSDEDRLDAAGEQRTAPAFKPDWSPDTLRCCNYIGHLTVYRRSLLQTVGQFQGSSAGVAEYDFLLRATEQATHVVHIPQVLYHGRLVDNARIADDEGARVALEEHLARQNVRASVRPGLLPATYEVAYRHERQPLVSIVIPNKDQARTLATSVESIQRSTYANYEIIIAENHSAEAETFACYERLERSPKVRVVTWRKPFNYAAINNFAVAHASGQVLLLLNNDIEVITPDWMERLLSHALRPEVGAVGAKLYYPDDTIQHAGVIVGLCDAAGHAHRYFPRSAAGYQNRLLLTQNFSAVTAACLMTRREVFEEINGFDERYVLAFNDVDLCLKMREKGYRIVWTPHVELYHHESKTRGYDVTTQKQSRLLRETHFFQARWPGYLGARDPYYNANLTWEWENFSLRINAAATGPVTAAIA